MIALTPEQSEKGLQRLIKLLQVDQQIVTYREISRDIRVNINLAKNILLQYLSTHRDDVFPTYLLSGSLLESDHVSARNGHPSNNSMDIDVPTSSLHMSDDQEDSSGILKPEVVLRNGMFLVGGDQLEAKMEFFKPGTTRVQIWSLSPIRVSDPAHYLPCMTRLRSFPKYHDPKTYGTITGDFQMERAAKQESSKASTSTAHLEAKPTIAKSNKPVNDPPQKAAGGIKGMFANAAAKKKEQNEVVKEKEKATMKEKTNADTVIKKERGNAKAEATTASKNMSKKQDVNMEPSAEDQAAMEALANMSYDGPSSDPAAMDTDDTFEDIRSAVSKFKGKKRTSAAAEIPASEDDATGKVGAGSGRVRKKRRVVRTVASTDAKGYACFDDVSSVESYSSDESTSKDTSKGVAKVKKESVAVKSFKEKPAASKVKGKPGNLQSFFTKKS